MEHFIAYHSAKTMGYELESSDELRFLSRKFGVLKKAVGNTVWVVQGIPNGKRTAFSLCGAYVAALGEGFCEVHHLVPLSASAESVTTTLNDLAVLCSNCHRIIHRSTPMLSVAELSKVVARGRPPNMALDLAPFGRWTLRDEAAQRRSPTTDSAGLPKIADSRGPAGTAQPDPGASSSPTCPAWRRAILADA